MIHYAFTPFCLWLAQVVSILGCLLSIAFPIYSLYQLNKTSRLDDLDPLGYATITIIPIFGFIYSYAMAVVFSQTRASQEKASARQTKRMV